MYTTVLRRLTGRSSIINVSIRQLKLDLSLWSGREVLMTLLQRLESQFGDKRPNRSPKGAALSVSAAAETITETETS